MRGHCNRSPSAWCWGGFVALFVTCSAWSQDSQLLRDLEQLGADDETTRHAALDKLSKSGDEGVADLLRAFGEGQLFRWKGRIVFVGQLGTDDDGLPTASLADPISREPIDQNGAQLVLPTRQLEDYTARRKDRLRVRNATLQIDLRSEDDSRRVAAIEKCGDLRDPVFLGAIDRIVASDAGERTVRAARISASIIRLSGRVQGQTREKALAAARELGELQSARGAPVLEAALELEASQDPGSLPADADARKVYRSSLDQIEGYQRWVRGFEHLFSGLSLGSVLILMALGLSITFGLMGVINMAHGELMMIGAYATFEVQRFFVASFSESAFDWYFVCAIPIAFLAAALVGYLIELLVVRHLYGRPLETLLATWGVGLILIQIVRLSYGNNIAVNSPTWLRGGAEVFQDFTLPFNRCFILVLTIGCVLAVWTVMRFTKMGLRVRATMQNREMASALGVNTRRVDGFTFALGAGIAGVAGCALTLLGGVTPDMGQNYIVDSFLVVVSGGVGELAGAVCAGMGIGMINKGIEPFTGAVWGKVLILLAVILFIQWRPAGLFPPKGRLADV